MRLSKIGTIVVLSTALLSFLLLSVFIKGTTSGNHIYFQTEKDKALGGPFETPNSASRYALTESIVENSNVLFTRELAEFSIPDLVTHEGKYFSIFMPGISFIGVPFYLLGKQFGMQQLFSYFSITIFAYINIFLVARLAYKLGAGLFASLLAGFIFLFGTNQLAYSSLYVQHATSVTFLLLSFLLVFDKRTVLNTVLFGILAGASLLIDVPNIIILVPIGIYFLLKHLKIENKDTKTKISFNAKFLTVFIGFIPFIVLLAWYNFNTTGNYGQVPQSLGQTLTLDPKEKGEEWIDPYHKSLPFVTKVQLVGTYTLLLSDERSVPVYTPVVILGIFGIIALYKKRQKMIAANIITGTILVNLLLYSMFGDPWGGWSFGPRYLIPAAAMLCIGLGVAIQMYRKKIWFIILFFITAIYSIFINVMGGLTTSLIPSKHDALNTDPQLPYTYIYNIKLINDNQLSSLLYNLFFPNLTSWIFVSVIIFLVVVVVVVLYIAAYRSQYLPKDTIV